MSNPSFLKKAASNRHPGQAHTRTPVDDTITHELVKARYIIHDLADHVFGHIVPTELARDILRQLVDDRIIHIFEETDRHSDNDCGTPLDPKSNGITTAIQEAFEDAHEYGCIRVAIEGNDGEPGSSSACAEGTQIRTSVKRRTGEQRMKGYSFKWNMFPGEPLREDQLVTFLNDITDYAFEFAKHRFTNTRLELRHRFAASQDKHHTMSLSYELDGEDTRPDFVLLPVEAFTDNFKVVDGRYMNFSALRLVGESKNKGLVAGVEQLQQYARGLKRAQPWVHYVLGMTVTKDKVVLLRGDGSGTERLELTLGDGRGCIEFIRMLLGLALADKVDLGHNPDVLMNWREQPCAARNIATSNSTRSTKQRKVRSVPDRIPRVPASGAGDRNFSAFATLCPVAVASSSVSKRAHSEIVGDDGEETQPRKRRAADKVDRIMFFPVTVYGYEYLGVLFTASSIRGRGTTVLCVTDTNDRAERLALKMAWQDLERVAEQDAVMEKAMSKGSHPNLIVPVRTFNAERKGRPCTTLGVIRGFTDEQIGNLHVENRVLIVSALELKRPVKYFWGVHDFVRGLRGALLGHEYLTSIGILHRDISENNIVLGLRPGDERGYLIDLDLSILQEAEEPTPIVPTTHEVDFWLSDMQTSSSPCIPDNGKPQAVKGLRTGTFPYISYNVLLGGRHTQFDDIESFLYVLFFFFFSYAGPLSAAELREADKAGFVQPIGSGRFSHMRSWPKEYTDWADGAPRTIGRQKHSILTHPSGARDIIADAEFQSCLKNNWPQDLHRPISALVGTCLMTFCESIPRSGAKGSRTEVSHAEFISKLDWWLEVHSDLEDKFSNCPFKQGPELKERVGLS